MKPVYIINGFLDSGKTEFICYTLEQPYFDIPGKTLLILCEEGENDYSEKLLKKSNTVIECIEEEEGFTPDSLLKLEQKHSPERIIIEYNGMWNFKYVKFPFHWQIEQQITVIDATTFSVYFGNMRSLLAEMLRDSHMIVLNRCLASQDLISYKRNIKAINQQAEIIFEDLSGEIRLESEELPYDLEAPIIELRNPGYGIWYLDALENPDRYAGKKVEFVGMVLKPESFPKGYFVPGRMAMTCCADDMAFIGYACYFEGLDQFHTKDWVRVIAEVKVEYWEDYQGEGPVLYALSVKKTKAPKEEIISFM